ncbi:hypothetical protein GWI33_017458 [Rhynchophorus ferrugineus]|uniref:Aminopeptidase N-like N-terminal domain-containing protein n=1 Tax=Rhynchophorus ferrugineus TaxID=354439 RepID=A0A834I9A0_RHYFE|nr:hypothetical protein GWI33_017458 [Rhynchophorus ferrugineus]
MSCCRKRTDKNADKKSGNKLVLYFCSCCAFWFILCVVLVTVLVFVGRHLLHNSIPPGVYYVYKQPSEDRPEIRQSSYKKLPNDTRPSLYDLTLFPHLDKDYFEGFVNISIDVYAPRKELILNSKNLSVSSVTLVRKNARIIQILSVTENLEDEVLVITPKEKVFPGEYFLGLKFSGRFFGKTKGLYRSTYRFENTTR